MQRPNPSPVRNGGGMSDSVCLNSAKAVAGAIDDTTDGLEYVYLKEYFGHEHFRGEQQEVIRAAVTGRDVAVFWATGAGKSLCYQLPAMQAGKTVIIVSPLISLMQDQVIKFNATVGAGDGGHRACFLGSAQTDQQVEGQALRGAYRLIYVTPEKITGGGGFLDRLKAMHQNQRLALLAIDEAHCISEWGHDFRPSYRQLRSIREILPNLPIMALTATAVPRVQEDIIEQLGLRKDMLVSRSSFDRVNLRIGCSRKSTQAKDLNRIAQDILSQGGSTIVYAPTQNTTETVANFLKERLAPNGITVMVYHGGMSPNSREDAHVAFLSGKAQVIVATVAFGMGIDKPDIRRIVHYGPPKTVEEYYQQIGRAGRDGLSSVCEMIAADSDFNAYSSEFYMKGLTAQGKEQQIASTAALRRYASEGCCRRKWLLQYFSETPTFGERCGTCDVCAAVATRGADTHRDFRQAAAPILEAVVATQNFPQSLTNLLVIAAGNFKPKGWGIDRAVTEASPRIKTMRAALPPRMKQESFTKEMVGMLCNAGYLARKRMESTIRDSFAKAFDVYIITDKGRQARCGSAEIRLPVPAAIHQLEEEERRKVEARAKEVQAAGFNAAKVPKEELEKGEGPMLWYIRKLKHWRDSGKSDAVKRADNHEELRKRINDWRDAVAQNLKMAPADVLPEHTVVNITYVKPTTAEDLRQVGVRIVGAEELAALILRAKQELFCEEQGNEGDVEQDTSSCGTKRSASMRLPVGPWTPAMKWPNAVYKPGRGGAKPPWEISYDRFQQGHSIQTIAMQQPSGKPIQPSTVVGHIFTSLTHAKPVDLTRLFQQADMSLPSEAEWTKIEEAAAERNCNVDASDFKSKEVLCGILGPENVNREPADKSAADKEQEAQWYGRIRVWEALKRARFPVAFGDGEEGDAKKPKLA